MHMHLFNTLTEGGGGHFDLQNTCIAMPQPTCGFTNDYHYLSVLVVTCRALMMLSRGM